MNKGDRCLVTGASGYLASWTIKLLLERGLRVRGTIRSLADKQKVDALERLLPGLELTAADLTRDSGWAEAVRHIDWVFHVASPQAVPSEKNRTAGAVQGVDHVMKAALSAASVRKILLTSSEAAIAYGHPRSKQRFTEDDWTQLDGPAGRNDYFRSKTLAEQAAWRLVRDPGLNRRGVPLSVINPGFILGPSLVPWARFSLETLQATAEGRTPVVLDMVTHMVDVRDCAAMHIALMDAPDLDDERCFSFAIEAPMVEMARSIARQFGSRGLKPRTRVTPNWVICAAGFLSGDAASIYSKLGHPNVYVTKHPDAFSYRYADLDRSVRDSIESMSEHGWLRLGPAEPSAGL